MVDYDNYDWLRWDNPWPWPVDQLAGKDDDNGK